MIGLYRVMALVAIVLVGVLSVFHTKLRMGWLGRWGLLKRLTQQSKKWKERPWWFHVASSGELEQCLPVLESLRKLDGAPIFLSYFSPSGRKAVELETDRRNELGIPLPWNFHDYAPFELPWHAKSYVRALNPRAFIAINRELWPELIRACKKYKVPMYLFATHFSNQALKYFGVYRKLLKEFRFIGATTEKTAQCLIKEHGLEATAVGDPRCERVSLRKERQKPAAWAKFFTEKPVFLVGSVWPQDFGALTQVFPYLVERDWRIVLAPHQPTASFVDSMRMYFREKHWPLRQWSHWLRAPDEGSHIVVDCIGSLAELYQVAELVFVGGSFKSRVHNILEPAVYGVPIITGPLISNSAEAVELASGGLHQVSRSDVLDAKVRDLIVSKKVREQCSQTLLQYVGSRQGIGAVYAKILHDAHA